MSATNVVEQATLSQITTTVLLQKELKSLKHLVRTTVSKSHNYNSNIKRRCYLAAHRRVVNVLTSNSAFLIFAVTVTIVRHRLNVARTTVLHMFRRMANH